METLGHTKEQLLAMQNILMQIAVSISDNQHITEFIVDVALSDQATDRYITNQEAGADPYHTANIDGQFEARNALANHPVGLAAYTLEEVKGADL